ncbi:hypothetical protein F0L17_22870 [Streptomyces sp. TRM43335]|uniref:Uncharacterized protein n=1 Tax=Streptomyces taklimakanensis TaxID=2569853 RepID=A0A6G2BJ37_9ACTN|nr:hypothetical protein [Streptomyces taklimakanensis]MTE21902.1 hypothetical protein [Streptomyces taklimakanensis]
MASGTWADGVKPYDRGEEWLDAHRFDLATALRPAEGAALRVVVNGYSVTGVLAAQKADADE